MFPVCFVHASDTTNYHKKEIKQAFRGRSVYATRSNQGCPCPPLQRRKKDVPQIHDSPVAAHVVAYPLCCVNYCFGCLTLKTVGNRQNHKRNATSPCTRAFPGCWLCRSNPILNQCVFYPCCFNYPFHEYAGKCFCWGRTRKANRPANYRNDSITPQYIIQVDDMV